jgi:hypothetical protein
VLALVRAHPEELDERSNSEVRERDAFAEDVPALPALRVDGCGKSAEPCLNACALLLCRHVRNGAQVDTHAGQALVVQCLARLVEHLVHAIEPQNEGVLCTSLSTTAKNKVPYQWLGAYHSDRPHQRIHERDLPLLRPGREERALWEALIEVLRDLERVRKAGARRGVRDCGQRVLTHTGELRDADLLGHPLDVCERDPHGLERDPLVDKGKSGETLSDGTRPDKYKETLLGFNRVERCWNTQARRDIVEHNRLGHGVQGEAASCSVLLVDSSEARAGFYNIQGSVTCEVRLSHLCSSLGNRLT